MLVGCENITILICNEMAWNPLFVFFGKEFHPLSEVGFRADT